jgi:NAD(P)H-hydrate epimerase
MLSTEQVRQVDRLAVEQYGMNSLVLMENAGRGCCDVLQSVAPGGTVVVCCGKGNNAGDGFVIARHLDLRRYAVRVLLWSPPDSLSGDALANYQILAKTDVPIHQLDGAGEALSRHLEGADWIVDALLGTGAKGAPRPPLDEVIAALNAAPARRLAVDVPSGLDCDTGQTARPTFLADHTCTFVAAKTGFAKEAARVVLGRVHVLDIGAPRKLVEQVMTSSK